MSDSPQEQEIKALGLILLRTGSMLMSNGASTARIRMTIDRIANNFGYDADLFITHRALTLSLSDKDNDHTFSSLKRTDPQGVNFKIVSGISRMSWSVKEHGWSFEQIEKELDSSKFVRVHRSYILNLDRIARIELYAKDSRMAILKDGTKLLISRAGYDKLKGLL